MSLTVNLPPEAEERLQREAAGMGLAVSELVRRLIESHLSRAPGDEATLALLAAWDKEDTTDDPRELEKRRLEWEEFKRAMNAGHSSHRTIYP
ncbi:MAG: ribbon-helix-helix protein, CopG family [Planctomycetes bacterium]|nr:ribbon-helix-helix protein, CopG family [Planctomycetota bacterium]